MMRLALPLLFLSVVGASCVASAASALPSLRAQRSVNSPPLTTEALRGNVIGYPIAIDNDFAIWRALRNAAWPAKYLFDDRGRSCAVGSETQSKLRA